MKIYISARMGISSVNFLMPAVLVECVLLLYQYCHQINDRHLILRTRTHAVLQHYLLLKASVVVGNMNALYKRPESCRTEAWNSNSISQKWRIKPSLISTFFYLKIIKILLLSLRYRFFLWLTFVLSCDRKQVLMHGHKSSVFKP